MIAEPPLNQAYGAPGVTAKRSPFQNWLTEFSAHDWLVFVYLIILNVAGLMAPEHPLKAQCQLEVGGLLAALLIVLVLVRGKLLRDLWAAPILYRLAIYGTVQMSYFVFRNYLPVVNPRSLDLDLHQLSLRYFGFEPAILMDRIVTPTTTEWFSFFYFGYFFVLAVHVIPILFLVRRQRVLGEFAMGMLVIFCIGHVLYMCVPGYGPYRAMAGEFHQAFPSGLWLDNVMSTVASAGAQKDIFPSLHTGAPTFITLFSYRHRATLPFRYTWAVLAFFTLNIIIATMFLRWHYVIDVVAGVLVAVFGRWISERVTDRELARRERLGLTANWPLIGVKS
ncbi:MAG TPA: phosphatase PAP2 family protein [Polyangiaceae bacterium]|nr:phosphatase PAP2 family protein [Polyangiaceae bacterium]